MGWLPLANGVVALASGLYLLDFFVVSRIAWFRKLLRLRKPSTEPRFWSLSRMLGVVIVAGGLALAFPPWDLWRLVVGGGVVSAFGVVSVVDYRKWKAVQPSPIADDALPPDWATRRRPLSQLTNDELYVATLQVSRSLRDMVGNAQTAMDLTGVLEKNVVAQYRASASVNVQALVAELERRGYDHPGVSQVAKDAKSLEEIGAIAQHLAISSNQIPAQIEPRSEGSVKPELAKPDRPPLVDVLRLAGQFTKTSKAIYGFLNKQAMRSDEPKVLAEYRQKFDATVSNLCLDLITAGLSDTEHMKYAMTPPGSLIEIQWIARFLAITGEGFGPRLERFARESGAGTFVTTKRTNEGRFPRIDSAADSFGHEIEREGNGDPFVFTGEVLTPGDQVTFRLELSDPDGADALVTVSPPGGLDGAHVSISADGIATWLVRDTDVSDPAYLFIFVRSRREFHRIHGDFDDSVAFVYRVVPRV
jgi:hypothetical protein